MPSEFRRHVIWMTIFFAAMAFLESAVVVYLRALYYPTGFDFPLVPMDRNLVTTEVAREAATLLMLLVPGALVARSALARFAWFCFGFGVWDIFYYVWLKVLLGWPESLSSRDLLFLIPVPWVGPVWAPCIVSLGLILLAMTLLYGRSKRPVGLVDVWTWSLLGLSAVLIFISFTMDPLLNSFSGKDLLLSDCVQQSQAIALQRGRSYIPVHFPWEWFVSGCIVGLLAVLRCFQRARVVG